EPIIGKRRPGRKAASILDIFNIAREKWPYVKLDSPSDVKVEHLMLCARCHLPQLEDAEDSVAQEIASDFLRWRDARIKKDAQTARAVEGKLAGLSITCLICHNRNAIVHKWTDGYPSSKTVYGAATKPHFCGKFPFSKRSPIQDDSLQCGQCHGLGPNFGTDSPTQCSTAYGSFLFDYKARGGDESCQDCHMRRTELGHNIQSYRHPVMIREALDFSAEVTLLPLIEGLRRGSLTDGKAIPKIRVVVKMTNKTGHPIPDGCPTTTRLILDVAAKTPNGNEFFFKEKAYMPIPKEYARGDKMGQGPFEKADLIVDTALTPLKLVTEVYEIPVPRDVVAAAGKSSGEDRNRIKVDVVLTYLPFGSTKASDDPILWRKSVHNVTLEDPD
ncbi:MAG TPA: multiheme c-type cytochrome ExtKL, partial [Syntrophales bacterium]